MTAKKTTGRKPSPETLALRREVAKYLKKNLDLSAMPKGQRTITEHDVNAAMPYVKRHIRKYIDTYWGTSWNPVEMCVQNYLAREFG